MRRYAPATRAATSARLEGAQRGVSVLRGRPTARRCSLVEAFAAPHRVALDDARVRYEVFAATAARLSPDEFTAPRAAADDGALSDAERALRQRVIDRAPWPRALLDAPADAPITGAW